MYKCYFLLYFRFYRCQADVVVTATYQASIEGYVKKFGVSPSEARALVTQGVTLAKQARDHMHSTTGQNGRGQHIDGYP